MRVCRCVRRKPFASPGAVASSAQSNLRAWTSCLRLPQRVARFHPVPASPPPPETRTLHPSPPLRRPALCAPQIRSFKLIEARLVSGRTAGKPAFAVPLYFLLALLPVIVPVALIFVSLASVAALAKVFMLMSERKSLREGFGLLGGVLYR